MEFVRSIASCNHLWAVKNANEEYDELTLLFRRWSDINYLLDFFEENLDDLIHFFQIRKISDAIRDTLEDANQLEQLILNFPQVESLDMVFRPLSQIDMTQTELTREKARYWKRRFHASWLRVYAVRVDTNMFIVTGGAIKLTRTMQERSHTQLELDKLNRCRDYLKDQGVFDTTSFMDHIEND